MFTVMFTPVAIRCLTCFHPICIPIMTLNQILHKRLGSWRHFSLVYTQWFWRQIFDSGQGLKLFSVYADCSSFFQCSISLLCWFYFELKVLGSDTSEGGTSKRMNVYVEQWTFTTRWSMSQSLCMLQRLCCTNSSIPFSFKCLFSFVTLSYRLLAF